VALIKGSALVGAVSGRMGSVVFKVGSGAAIAARYSGVKTRSSVLQLERQAVYAILRQTWAGMSEQLRRAWDKRARQLMFVNRVGVRRGFSGRVLFFKFNLARCGFGVEPWTEPPWTSQNAQLNYAVFSWIGWPPLIGVFTAWVNAGSFFFLYVARTFRSWGPCSTHRWRPAHWGIAGNFSYDVTEAFTSQLGTPQSGEWVGAKIVADGLPALGGGPWVTWGQVP